MHGDNPTVLVAEDSATVRGLVSRIFRRAGFDVVEVDDGLDALTHLLTQHPDVAILDHHMPGCSGLEVLRRVRARPDGDTIGIVLLTGDEDRNGAADALSAGADDFIRKPCDPAELVARVRKVLQTRRRVADLDRRSSTDPLTGLPNRRGMEPVLEALAGPQGSSTALLVVDIDHFKAVNDTHGHDAGDLILRTVAGRLSACAAQLTVARWGGEEFVAAGRCDGPVELARLAEGLRRAVAAVPCELVDGDDITAVPVTVSIGGALVPNGTALGEVLTQADAALYAAKEAGRNVVVLVTAEGLEVLRPAASGALSDDAADLAAARGRRGESTAHGLDLGFLDPTAPPRRPHDPGREGRTAALDGLEGFLRR